MNSTLEKTLKSDSELKKDVLAELEYEPSVKVTDLGVLVHDGIITLTGHTSSYNGKQEAVRSVQRIAGVKAIADEIEVQLPNYISHTDEDIAMIAAKHLDWSTTIPGAVRVTVRHGWITLEGEVEWWYMKNAAANVVYHLSGVKGVSNLITIRPRLTASEVKGDIRSAFERSALLDASKVQVETSGNTVILRGKVRNYAERDEAERVAWAASGVLAVENHLTVSWSQFNE